VEPEDFQSRLWDMFPQLMRGTLSLPQIDRVRWNLFPEVRVPEQGALFDDADDNATIPDFLRVMDLQQEQPARSLRDGHRVIHGVAGSGKTMILGYRAEYLAKAATHATKPVLVLCYNEPLGVKPHAMMRAKGTAMDAIKEAADRGQSRGTCRKTRSASRSGPGSSAQDAAPGGV